MFKHFLNTLYIYKTNFEFSFTIFNNVLHYIAIIKYKLYYYKAYP